jgi:hypothetical protein
MKTCFQSTHHPFFMVRWWMLVESGQVVQSVNRVNMGLVDSNKYQVRSALTKEEAM